MVLEPQQRERITVFEVLLSSFLQIGLFLFTITSILFFDLLIASSYFFKNNGEDTFRVGIVHNSKTNTNESRNIIGLSKRVYFITYKTVENTTNSVKYWNQHYLIYGHFKDKVFSKFGKFAHFQHFEFANPIKHKDLY